MPRAKRADVLTVAPGPSPVAEAEVWATINDLLLFANDPPPTDPPFVARRWTELQQALTLLSQGHNMHSVRSWPLRAAMTFDNLAQIVHARGRYLHRCSQCQQWFIARDARRRICFQKECEKTAHRQRAARDRHREREQRQRASRAIKGTKRTG